MLPECPECPECGALLTDKSLKTICPDCLNRRYLRVMRQREVESYTFTPVYKVELAFDRRERGPRHITFPGERHLAYCGAFPNESPRSRLYLLVTDLEKQHVCPGCIKILQEIERRACQKQEAAKGATP